MTATIDLSTGKITGCVEGSKTYYHELGHKAFNETSWGSSIDYYQYFFMMITVFFLCLSVLINSKLLHLFTFLNGLGMICSYLFQEVWAWTWGLKQYYKSQRDIICNNN